MSDYPTYRQYFTAEQAEPVLMMLKEHQIPFEFVQNRGVVDAIIGGETSSSDLYNLKIPAGYFERVNKLLEQQTVVNLDELDADHYLLSFTDSELQDILRKPDEWSIQDVAIAKALLNKKGIGYDDEYLDDLKRKRLDKLARSERINRAVLVLGYITVFFGAGAAIIMGLSIWRLKKTLPDGRRVFMYDFSSRQHGKSIFILGLIVFLVAVFGDLGALNHILFWMAPSLFF